MENGFDAEPKIWRQQQRENKMKWKRNEKETKKKRKEIEIYWNNLTDKKNSGITTVLFPFLYIDFLEFSHL